MVGKFWVSSVKVVAFSPFGLRMPPLYYYNFNTTRQCNHEKLTDMRKLRVRPVASFAAPINCPTTSRNVAESTCASVVSSGRLVHRLSLNIKEHAQINMECAKLSPPTQTWEREGSDQPTSWAAAKNVKTTPFSRLE